MLSRAHYFMKPRGKYHVVFIPKYRRKVIYGKLRRQVGSILRNLCVQKGVELLEGHALSLKPFEDLLKLDDASIRKVLKSWGPGKYDAELDQDGRAVRPDGKSAATVLPPAFGLAGVNLVFEGKGKCATCHVPPLFSEPGWPMHTAEEIGIDDFQAGRSPDKESSAERLRSGGLFVRMKGGFYHDDRFAGLEEVIAHYEKILQLQLAPEERRDLTEYLKSL